MLFNPRNITDAPLNVLRGHRVEEQPCSTDIQEAGNPEPESLNPKPKPYTLNPKPG